MAGNDNESLSMTVLRFFVLSVVIAVLLIVPPAARAQFGGFGVATTHSIEDQNPQDGDIVSLSAETGNLRITSVEYDEKMFGVVSLAPAIVLHTTGFNTPIVRTGETQVNVTTLNGSISIGDYVTSSPIPGKGQKATDFNGYVLGIALQPFSQTDGTLLDYEGTEVSQGKILVAVGISATTPFIKKVSGGFLGSLQYTGELLLYMLAATKESERIMRYILAVLVAIVSLYISFRSFGHNVTNGIESIGLNPMAKGSIQTMIVVNIVLIAIVSLGGILLSLIIISL